MENTLNIIDKSERAATDILLSTPESMVYHNLNHTREVVSAADKIGTYANLSEEEKEILLISAWFHDTGYKYTYENHEKKSIELARDFLNKNNYPKENIEKVVSCILATKSGQKPSTLTEKVLIDADFMHLSKKAILTNSSY